MGSADEFRLALRRLLKRPAATLAAVVTLAVSIGAATATWSLLSAVLLRPLPVAGADRLMVVGTQVMQGRDAGTLRMTHLYPYYPHIRDSGIFESVAAQWLSPPQLLVSTGGIPVQTSVGFATHKFLRRPWRSYTSWTQLPWRRRSTRRGAGRHPHRTLLAPRGSKAAPRHLGERSRWRASQSSS